MASARRRPGNLAGDQPDQVGIPFADLDALTSEVWDRIYATNVRGPFLLARAAAAVLREDGGRIVNIASVGGIYPGGSSIAYATSKAALIHLTRCLVVALAPDVLVNTVALGLIEDTRMAQRLPAAVVDAARRSAVLGRSVTLPDLADQVVAFCRTDSITGQVLPIDAGLFPGDRSRPASATARPIGAATPRKRIKRSGYDSRDCEAFRKLSGRS